MTDGPVMTPAEDETISASIHALAGHLDACLDSIGRTDVHSIDWLRDFIESEAKP